MPISPTAASALPLATSDVDKNTFRAWMDQVESLLNAREALTADRTYYVRTDGNDSNTGLTNTAGGAFRTIQKAMDVVAASLDLGPYNVTVQIGTGTYTSGIELKTYRATSGAVTFLGNSGSPASVAITTAGNAVNNGSGVIGSFTFNGMSFASSAGLAAAVLFGATVNASFTNCIFSTCTNFQLYVTNLATAVLTGTNYIGGNATVGLWATRQGVISSAGSTINFLVAAAYSAGFVRATEAGVLDAYSMTFSGSAASVTGQRYLSVGASVILVNGAGANYFPGNSAGALVSNGVYY